MLSSLHRSAAALALGALLGAGAMLAAWRPWRSLAPPPLVVATGPVTLEPRVVYEIRTAQPGRLRPTGETVTVPVQEPATPAVQRQLDRRFGELEQLGSILGEAELGRLAYGGHAVIAQPEDGGPLTLALAASRPPLGRWDTLHRWSLAGGVATPQGGTWERRLRLSYEPGEVRIRRRWSVTPRIEIELAPDAYSGQQWQAAAWVGVARCGGRECW